MLIPMLYFLVWLRSNQCMTCVSNISISYCFRTGEISKHEVSSSVLVAIIRCLHRHIIRPTPFPHFQPRPCRTSILPAFASQRLHNVQKPAMCFTNIAPEHNFPLPLAALSSTISGIRYLERSPSYRLPLPSRWLERKLFELGNCSSSDAL
jgi:hypothetical protein